MIYFIPFALPIPITTHFILRTKNNHPSSHSPSHFSYAITSTTAITFTFIFIFTASLESFI